MTDYTQLIPELKKWNNGRGIDVESWIGCEGDFKKAIGYSTIFWPTFIEIEGCIVRERVRKENVLQWITHCKGDTKSVEATVNHIHLEDLHHQDCADISPERLAYLGRVLKEIYECKLNRDYPNRKFEVIYEEPEVKENLSDYILTFYQTK